MKPTKIHLLTYEHRHGVTRYAFTSGIAALVRAGELLTEYADEVTNTDVRDLIVASIGKGDIGTALEAWEAWQQDFGAPPETITIEPLDVEGPAIAVKPAKKGFQKWVVEIEVSDTWVMDGFEMTDERTHSIMAHELAHAHGSEIRAKVLHAPPPAVMAELQGYATIEAWEKSR